MAIKRRLVPKGRQRVEQTAKAKGRKKIKPKYEHKPEVNPQQEVIVQYEQAQCTFVEVTKSGKKTRCLKHAVGKSSMCLRHNPNAQEHQVQVSSTLTPSISSKYDPTVHMLGFIRCSQEGKAPVEIAAEFQIAQKTLLSWAEKYQDFNDAVEIGKAAYESFWLQKGRDNLTTKAFNTSLYKFLTGNTLGYSDKVETKSMNMNVHGVLCIPAAVEGPGSTADAWQEAAMKAADVPQPDDVNMGRDAGEADTEDAEIV